MRGHMHDQWTAWRARETKGGRSMEDDDDVDDGGETRSEAMNV